VRETSLTLWRQTMGGRALGHGVHDRLSQILAEDEGEDSATTAEQGNLLTELQHGLQQTL